MGGGCASDAERDLDRHSCAGKERVGVAGEICKECPQAKVLILSQYDEPENMIVAKKARAYGFIPKKAAGYDLITGMRTVDAGKYFPASFAEVSKNQRSGMGRFAGL